MRQRPMKMDAWGISFDAYKELYHFCQQYGEKKRRADEFLTLPGSALRVERVPGSDEGCKSWGLEFNAVNENLPEMTAHYGNDSRKIGADIYIDDKSLKEVAGS